MKLRICITISSELQLYTSCLDLQADHPGISDGEYWFHLTDPNNGVSAVIPVYCDDMANTAKEYITLPEGVGVNHAMRYRYQGAQPPTCVSGIEVSNWGTQTYHKIRFNIEVSSFAFYFFLSSLKCILKALYVNHFKIP